MADDIQTYLKKVLQSSEFQNSPKYQKLLKYLVNSTLEGNVPKEITIAMELYNIDMKDDTSGESNIRVYIHNIRKKLDYYYVNEGKNDKIHFRIPKGRYEVEFIKKKYDRRGIYRNLYLVIGSVVAFLITVDILFFRLNPALNSRIVNSKYSKTIWSDFLNKEFPLAIVIGDYYLLKDTTFSDRTRFLRDVRINSEGDLDEFLLNFPEYNEILTRTKHTFMGKYAAICINELGKIMHSAGVDFKIILSSEFQWQDLLNYNIIYIGSFKSLGMLNQLTKNSNFRYNLYPNDLQFHELESDSIFYYYPMGSDIENAFETDYSVVTKLPGSGQQNVLVLLSVRDIGLIATVDYITNLETLRSFELILHSNNEDLDYFEACFKIQGVQRHSMSIDLLHINRLSPTSLFEMDPGVEDSP